MDCKKTQETLCDYSAQACDDDTSRALETHLAQCPPCEKEWRALKASLMQLSTATQELPSFEQSFAMWAECEKKIAASQLAPAASLPVIAIAPQAAPTPSFGERVRQALGLQPRFGWFALGGAFAVLCGAMLSSPSTSVTAPPQNNAREYSQVVQSSVRDETPAQLVSAKTQTPPRAAALFIDHHTAMSFDPFTDHVGPTLVSFSASSPSER